ncbi:MAG: bifunctional phosphoribosyl-AMP cyclohydrolase/phosphoribosyl-ATP diphosphatase HisIE [Lachnospiraceae bacterium]|nr:bifunctional phosphoribosyl-AMP cyclohydrolase/phosphoribosyl-ATP diphosphatase HisIE [Lachnospiraceae bacterium]
MDSQTIENQVEDKNLVATIYIKNGKAVKSRTDMSPAGELLELAMLYNDSGIDKIMVLDLSDSDDEHERNIRAIRGLNRNLEVKVCAGGNISRLEDIKKLLYAGCAQIILNGSKPGTMDLAAEGSERFGKDRLLVSVDTVDFIFKNREKMEAIFHEVILMNPKLLDAVANISSLPCIVAQDVFDMDEFERIMKCENVRGLCGAAINETKDDIMKLKYELAMRDVKMDNFNPELNWSDMKLNSDGLVPVVTQDYKTNQVLMVAYMNEESFLHTIISGKMTYYSRSRQKLWLKGEESGHFQYVKSLTADCDYDTILAKVSQVGNACHTGAYSCFFNTIVAKDYVDKNPLKIFESLYNVVLDRKENPKAGSYTNYLFDKGIDKMLKKLGEESTEVVIAAKNPDTDELKYEMCDYLYHLTVLMVEKGITWEDIVSELSQR